MNFILKMAWRDSRASRRRLAIYSLSIMFGIAALVSIGSLSANVRTAIDEQAKGLLGADLIISSRTELAEETQRYVASVATDRARETSFSSMMMFPTANNLTRMVNVRAWEGMFPFYGEFTTVPVDGPAVFRAGGNVVILDESLMRQFDAKVGDAVKLGDSTFKIVGALQKVPGDSSAISATFAPRALIPMSALAATGLSGKATLVRYRTMVKLAPTQPAENVVREMRSKFRDDRLNFDTVEERKRNLGRALENIEGFLSLVGFVALFLGAIGVASSVHSYVQQKISTVAVLRCLGASAQQSFAVYLVQGLALGILGATSGVGLGLLVQWVFPFLLKGVLPFNVEFAIAWAALSRGVIAGLIICLLFTILPLLAVRKVSPLVALRSAFADTKPGPDPWRIAIGVFIGASVTIFAVWQTNSLRNGLGFAIALAVGFGVLGGLAQLVSWAARKWFPRRAPYVARQGVANLYRPQNRTVLLVLALGLGTFLMLTLYLSRGTLLKEIEVSGGAGRANLLFFDIQDDQIEQVRKITAAEGTPVQVQAPIVTMRIAKLRGIPVEEILRTNRTRPSETKPEKKGEEVRVEGWTLRREYRSTFRNRLEGAERIVQGKFVGKVDAGEAVVPISIEESLARDMGAKLGDEIEWDVQGVPIRSRVASVRFVEWRRIEPNFFVVFPEGVLEGAPKFYVAAVRAADAVQSAKVQRAVITALPSVTAFDVALILEAVDAIFSKVAFAVQLMALFTVVTGVFVLAGAVMTGRFQRIRETVLLRTLGATRQQLTRIMLVEYTVLGVLAAITGGLLAVVANVLLAKFIFRINPSVPPLELALAVVGAVGVTLATGLFANRGITDHPPLEVLRQET